MVESSIAPAGVAPRDALGHIRGKRTDRALVPTLDLPPGSPERFGALCGLCRPDPHQGLAFPWSEWGALGQVLPSSWEQEVCPPAHLCSQAELEGHCDLCDVPGLRQKLQIVILAARRKLPLNLITVF